MHTILGAGGPIADGLARALHDHGITDIRLVSRHPKKVNDSDHLVAADLMDAAATSRAVAGSEIAYLTVGLPADSALWEEKFPVMMRNTIDACAEHGTKLVFFDNTYMYPGTPIAQTEATGFAPNGRKGRVRARVTTALLDAMDDNRVEALIGRAPEFYGPVPTKSVTNQLVFGRIRAGRRPLVPVNAQTKRSLIWTPDASRALALLGNTPGAYGRTWHLPIDTARLTYAEMIEVASAVAGRRIGYTVLPKRLITVAARVNSQTAEIEELLPRYEGDNIFDSSAFAAAFPDFRVTTYREGISTILAG